MKKKPNQRKAARPAKPQPAPSPSLTKEEVIRDIRRYLAKAVDSGKFMVFIGYTEDGVHFSEHKSGGMPAGDMLWVGRKIAEDIEKSFAQSRPEPEGPRRPVKP